MKNIESQVLRLIGEDPTAPDVFLDTSEGMTEIRDSINDATEEICLMTGAIKRTYQLLLRQDQTYYRLDFTRDQLGWITDAWLPVYKRRLEQTDIYRLNAFNPRWMQNSGTPQSYFPVGHKILGFWPAPSADTMMVELTCVIIPDRYETEDERLKMREAWEDICVFFATTEFYASRFNVKQATFDMQKYIEKLGGLAGYALTPDRRWGLQTAKEPWPKPSGG